jgi:erythromycin esterase-like protein
MTKNAEDKLIELIGEASEPLRQDADDPYVSLLDKIGDARVVMIGEASHGTHEFYQARIDITKKLITEKGFMGVAIEGDWPDAHHVHRYIQGQGNRDDSIKSLEHFKRFPTWMWRNTTMPPFLNWLREHNDAIQNPSDKLGFYGLDLYNMNASMHAIIDYLRKVDPKEAERVIEYYSCFDPIDLDPQSYGYLAEAGLKQNCIDEVIAVLYELQQHAFEYVYKEDNKALAEDAYFSAIQNARLIKNAENYYRSLFKKDCDSWNIRDRHMAEILHVLLEKLEQQHNKPAKIVVWAHNSHVGDARATEMSDRGEVNLGQLIREQHKDTYNIGFSTYEGYVTAAYNWGEPAEQKKINPGIPGSYEDLFHRVKHENFILDLMNHEELRYKLQLPRLQRAIGVIYRPETERMSHYFFTHLIRQFNCMIHFDKTQALQPLDINSAWRDIR